MAALTWRFFLIAFSIGLSHPAPVNEVNDGNVMTMRAFNNSLGTFVEFTGRAAIAMEDWTIYASFNLDQLFKESAVLKTGYEVLKKFCETNDASCLDFLFFELTEFGDTILHRGLTKKADLQDFRLKQLPLGDEEIADLLADKCSVVDITTNIKESVQNRLNQLELDIDRIGNNHETKAWYIYYVSAQLSALDAHIKRSQAALLEALTSAYQGRLTPLILSLKQLEAEVLKIQAHVPPGRRLPFDQSTASDVYHIASVSSQQLNDNHLIFTVKVPLIDAELFGLYHLTPIPRVENGQIEVLDTETPYLAINDHQDRYFPLQKLGDCTEVVRERFICRHNQVTYGKGSSSNIPCSLAAFRNQSTGACRFRRVEQSSLWTQLIAPNSWVVATTEELSLTAVCSDDRQELSINGSGILSIRSDCIVRSSAVILQGKPQQKGPSKTGYASVQPNNNSGSQISIQAALHRLQLRLDQQQMATGAETPIAVIAVCPVIALIAILLTIVWLHRYHRKRQLIGAQGPVNDPVNDNHRPQVTPKETTDGHLPLLEKPL